MISSSIFKLSFKTMSALPSIFAFSSRALLMMCFINLLLLTVISSSSNCLAASIGNLPLGVLDNLLLAPSNFSAPEWSAILARMTAANPCGSSANYTLCQQCALSTGNMGAFYFCCVNTDDVRQFCFDFVNHTIP